MTDRLICQSCDEPKQALKRVNSRIATEWSINLCHDCASNKFEPRYLLILAVRQFGMNKVVEDYIKNHKYVGKEISAKDILV